MEIVPREPDTLRRFVFEHAPIRGGIVHLDATWQAVLERHPYPPRVRALLGQFLAATALLAATVKFDGSLILQAQGEGETAPLLVAEARPGGTLRGLAHWSGEDIPAGGLEAVFGPDARLVITIDPGAGMDRYQGIVALTGAGLAEALVDYFTRSEQLETRLWLAADEHTAAGMLLQRIPEAPMEDADAWNRALTLAATLSDGELLELPARRILQRLFHEEDVRLFEREPVAFRCTCTRERVENMLRGLGEAEVQDILAEQGRVEVSCEFCNQRYTFDAVDVARLFATEPVAPAPKTRQ